jgi:hypothetical protein
VKIGTLRKLRTWALRKRELHFRAYQDEQYGPMNLYRPRCEGRVEAYDAVIDRLDKLLKSAHDKWHDRRNR